MKRLAGPPFDQWRDKSERVRRAMGSAGDDGNGAFIVPCHGVSLYVLASTGLGWDHVSVHVQGHRRCPTWDEMVYVKRAFFERDEWACELHPPAHKNISAHPYCLHLWRCQYAELPLPHPVMIAPTT